MSQPLKALHKPDYFLHSRESSEQSYGENNVTQSRMRRSSDRATSVPTAHVSPTLSRRNYSNERRRQGRPASDGLGWSTLLPSYYSMLGSSSNYKTDDSQLYHNADESLYAGNYPWTRGNQREQVALMRMRSSSYRPGLSEQEQLKRMSMSRPSNVEESTNDIDFLRDKMAILEEENELLKRKFGEPKTLDNLENSCGVKSSLMSERQARFEVEKRALRESRSLQMQLRVEKDKVKEVSEKLELIEEDKNSLLVKVEKLERYLCDLPSERQTKELKCSLENEHSDKMKIEDELAVLGKKYSLLQKSHESQKLMAKSAISENDELHTKLKVLSEKLDLHTNAGSLNNYMEGLSLENAKLKEENSRTKMLIDTQARKVKEANEKSDSANKLLKHNEGMILALQRELEEKEESLHKIRTTYSNLAEENQKLLEQLLVLQEKQHASEKILGGDAQSIEHRLLWEIGSTLTELDSLLCVISQHATGQQPDIPLILSSQSYDVSEETETVDTLEQLRARLITAKSLRSKVDSLRQQAADKIAEDLGSNMTCAQQ